MAIDDKPINTKRRNLLAAASATLMAAAADRVLGQSAPAVPSRDLFSYRDVTIHYQVTGTGFPLLVISGGGLNSRIPPPNPARAPFNVIGEFSSEYRCIAMDQRNANGGQSSGPLEVDRPWDAYTDDQLALMDHLEIDQFLVIGWCIGGPFIWNLLERAGDRIPAAVSMQPVGYNAEEPDYMFESMKSNWGQPLVESRSDISMSMAEQFLNNAFRSGNDFVLSASREFVQGCQTPILILPDDTTEHPYDVAIESAMLAPNAQLSLYPWKHPPERIPLAIRHIRTFIKAHTPSNA